MLLSKKNIILHELDNDVMISVIMKETPNMTQMLLLCVRKICHVEYSMYKLNTDTISSVHYGTAPSAVTDAVVSSSNVKYSPSSLFIN